MDVAIVHLWANGYIVDEPVAVPAPEPVKPVKTKRKRRK